MAVASAVSANIWRPRARARLAGYAYASVFVLVGAISGHLERPAVPFVITVAGLGFALAARRHTEAVFVVAVVFDTLAIAYLALMADSWTLAALAAVTGGAVVAAASRAPATMPVMALTVGAVVVLVLGEQGAIDRPSFIPTLAAPFDRFATLTVAVALTAVTILLVRRMVTARHDEAKVEVTDHRWSEFTESATQPVIVTIDGTVVRANPSAAEITGRPAESLAGMPITDLIVGGAITRPDGTVAHVTVVTAPMTTDVEGTEVMLLIDTSETVEERRVLERSVQDADRILASVSHEVRTPLTAVVGLSSVADEAWEDLSSSEQRDFVRLIASQSRDVAAIIEDLLVAARVGTTGIRIDRKPVDLGIEVSGVLVALDMAGRDVRVIGSATASADSGRVRQILRNLLTNAVRYGGEEIEVRLRMSDTMAEVVVADSGEAIPLEARERIFEPFGRTGNATPGHDSVGLGLTVSRQLAELMNGGLEYDHHEGWSRFILTLPTHTP